MSDEKYLFADESDEILFADDETGGFVSEINSNPPWKVLIVDDDEGVHRMTRFVLSDINYASRPVEFVSCYSGQEARECLKKDHGICVILLDVVMETDDAGLRVVKYIREELENSVVRIILRTGQPGQAPEQEVIINYDINDYKSKSELTSDQLFTSLISALRSFNDIETIAKNRNGLERIIHSSTGVFELQTKENFVKGLLSQYATVLGLDADDVDQFSGFTAIEQKGKIEIVAACGIFKHDAGKSIDEISDNANKEEIRKSIESQNHIFQNNVFCGYFVFNKRIPFFVYFEKSNRFEDWEKDLIGVFNSNVLVASANVYLNQELENLVRERTSDLEAANIKLKAISLSDPLTALFNRRYLYEHVYNISSRFLKSKINSYQGVEKRQLGISDVVFGVYLLDIDHFKKINDTYGHKAGDAVLKKLAAYLKQTVRADDFVLRWGGEEFLVILQNTKEDYLDVFSAKLLNEIQNLKIDLNNSEKEISITCSAGYTKLPFVDLSPDLFSLEQIINFADYALYKAKENGRNRAYSICLSNTDNISEEALAYVADLTKDSEYRKDLIQLKEVFPG